MAIDTTPSTVATNALSAIPYGALIGGPLDACVKAQALAAQTSWEFIKNVGLTVDKDGNSITRQVVFQYQKNGQMFNLVVPLLAIVPIPYIAIDTITIDFKANISASSSSVQEQSTSENIGAELDAKASLGWGPFSLSVEFKANYSSKKDSKSTQDSKYSVEYTMDIHVAAGQSDMPAGLAAMLNILQSSMTEANPNGSLQGPASISFTATTQNKFDVVVTDKQGLAVAGLGADQFTLTDSAATPVVKLDPGQTTKTDSSGKISLTATPTPPGGTPAPTTATGTLTLTATLPGSLKPSTSIPYTWSAS
jgi:hypothetical protein